ncbi:MAG TPA: Eco57I restriction-modification methylase domain-containing protein [Nocardioidaceae bacterium]|nr:Eco57I restriction-modification methylase domain-containing protein [Nocardioidaceae bacterium]
MSIAEVDLDAERLGATRPDGAAHGVVFTRRWVVDLILDLAGYTTDRDLAALTAVEPACGSGAFLLPMIERLIASCQRHGRGIHEAMGSLVAFDLVPGHVAAARQAVSDELLRHSIPQATATEMATHWVREGDFILQSHIRPESADFVIGNPPYVRLEALPEHRLRAYRNRCRTMSGRADLFVGFYEVGLAALRADGVLAYICADRWMRNSYGRALRELVDRNYSVESVTVAHDVDAFEADVSAYPAITVMRRAKQGSVVVAEANAAFSEDSARELVDWCSRPFDGPISRGGVHATRLDGWFSGGASWPTGSPERLAVLADIEERLPLLEDVTTGTRLGVGVATGADRLFVTQDPDLVERSQMLPLAMVRDTRSGEFQWSGNYLVSPWDDHGPVDLAAFPKLAGYYASHEANLRRRSVAQRQPVWYRTIDRVNSSLTDAPKLLFADMNSRIWPVLEAGGHYPHHNLYWLTSSQWDLKVLGGLLLSDIAEMFVSTYCVKMRGGTLRFQAQYLRRIRVPRYADISSEDRAALVEAFDRRCTAAATAVALRLYGIDQLPM